MRRWILTTVAIGVAFSAGWAIAHEGESHGESQEHGGATPGVTGEVVDLACYLGEGLKGAGHQECARKCIASGLPVGILSGDKVYLAIGSEHGPANAALASLAAQQVTVEGNVTERDGVHLLVVKKVRLEE